MQQEPRRELSSADLVAEIPLVIVNAYCTQPRHKVCVGDAATGHFGAQYSFRHFFPVGSINLKEDRVDRRLKEHQTGKRRVVVVMRERLGRTLPKVAMAEAEGVALVTANVDRMATLSADEASHWDMLHAGWQVDRVNHSVAYSDHGKHTNWAESYFSRLRRMVVGQHHHVSPQYLHQYANHAAWLEDNRHKDNGALAFGLVQNAMGAPVSRAWKGYWQRSA